MTNDSVDRVALPPPGYYRIDIRVFTVCLTLVMTASFLAGFVLVPPYSESWNVLSQLVLQTTTSSGISTSTTPDQPRSKLIGDNEEIDSTGGTSTSKTKKSGTPMNNAEDAKVVRDAFLVNASERLVKSEEARRNAEAARIAAANDPDSDLHLPSGQHLLVDIKGVESAFLNSEERLSKAMVDTIEEAGYVTGLFCFV